MFSISAPASASLSLILFLLLFVFPSSSFSFLPPSLLFAPPLLFFLPFPLLSLSCLLSCFTPFLSLLFYFSQFVCAPHPLFSCIGLNSSLSLPRCFHFPAPVFPVRLSSDISPHQKHSLQASACHCLLPLPVSLKAAVFPVSPPSLGTLSLVYMNTSDLVSSIDLHKCPLRS